MPDFSQEKGLTKAAKKHIIPFASGLVAQLGAHHIRIVGVEGSNPFKSTKNRQASLEVCRFLLLHASLNPVTEGKNKCYDFLKIKTCSSW